MVVDLARLISFEKWLERTARPYPCIVLKMANACLVPREVPLVQAGYVPRMLGQGVGEALVEVAVERLGW